MKRFLKFLARPYRLEIFFWSAALIVPLFINPVGNHTSLCLFHNLGIDFCPGCGLGRSLAYLYRGDITHSFLSHPLGIIVFGILLFRIVTLSVKLKQVKYSLEGGANG